MIVTVRIPSLDGLRAISIFMVLIGHALFSYHGEYRVGWSYLGNGDLGVSIFFVISGFLITTLLLREFEKNGDISLRHFYLRRALRILPPFYTFLLAVVIVWHLGWITSDWRSWSSSSFFIRDYMLPGDWYTGHSWSLSIEEQFYLLWPAALVFLGRKRGLGLALALIAASPLVRVISHKFWNHGNLDAFMFHMRMDGLMMGCTLAIVHGEPWFGQAWKRIERPMVVLGSLVFLCGVSPALSHRFAGYYRMPVGYTLDNAAICYLLFYFVRNPLSIGGRILNWRPVVHLGVLSYSLYLWQQLFLGPGIAHPILGVFCAFLCSEVSWHIVERPSLRLRDLTVSKDRSPMPNAADSASPDNPYGMSAISWDGS